MDDCKTIQFTVLGGGGEVGASCFQLAFNGQTVLLDSGTHPKKDGFEALPAFSLLRKSPDCLLVSHAHVDHCGSVPYLLRQFPLTRVFATLPTVRIMDRMLHNSVSVMETIAKERGVEGYPLYDHEDVGYAMRLVKGMNLRAPFNLPVDVPVEASFHHAGHVLGSASILMKFPGHTVLYTGDICDTDQEIMGGMAPLPKDLEVDSLIIESTHGATEEARVRSYAEETERLGDDMDKVLRGGGVVMVPCFALGRMQEMLNIIMRLQEEGKVPPVPVYASGLGRAVYEVYERFPEYLKEGSTLRPLDLFGRIGNVWEPQILSELLVRPCIIVATSGMMLENTPSAVLAQQMVRERRHGIFFVGYLDHETLGYKLLHAEPGARLQFMVGQPPVPIELNNIKRFHFSAHAPRKQLVGVVERLKPKNVVFVHGDPDALAWMQQHTGNGRQAFAPTIGQTITLEA